jgi:hypothetical protein
MSAKQMQHSSNWRRYWQKPHKDARYSEVMGIKPPEQKPEQEHIEDVLKEIKRLREEKKL